MATAQQNRDATPRLGPDPLGPPPDDRPRPSLPAPVARATAGFFGTLSAVRGSRIFHPAGEVHEATLSGAGAGTGSDFFDDPAGRRAIVRLSRAIGLPAPVPDIFGIAIRVPDAHGAGAHQDLLLATSLDAPVLRHLLVPARGPRSRSYSSLLLYRIAGRLRLVGAIPVDDSHFDLALAPPFGRWTRVARLSLDSRISGDRADRLSFNPWVTGGDVRPVGSLNALRDSAYEGSRRGRGGTA